jgi:hypothetical protein
VKPDQLCAMRPSIESRRITNEIASTSTGMVAPHQRVLLAGHHHILIRHIGDLVSNILERWSNRVKNTVMERK